MSDATAVREVLRLTHPIEDVWRAVTDADWLTGWHAETVTGQMETGRSVMLHWPSLGMDLDLDVVVARAPDRLELRGGPPTVPPQALTISLLDRGDATDVTIEHSGFDLDRHGQLERAGTAAGWYTLLRVLEHYLRSYKGRARQCVSVLAPAPCSLERVGELIATSSGLARWLRYHGDNLEQDAPVALGLDGDMTVDGRVLANRAPFELAVAADSIAGVLMLRGIHMDPAAQATLVGIQAWSWQPELIEWIELQAILPGAVQRLVDAAGGPISPGSA